MRNCAFGILLLAAIGGCGSRTPLAPDRQSIAHQIPVLLPAGPNQDGRAWEEMQAAWVTLDRTEGAAPALNREVLGRQAGVSSAHDKGPALVLALETSDSMLWSLREKQLALAKDLVAALPKDARVTVVIVDWLTRAIVEGGSSEETKAALDRVASVVSAGRFSPERLREPLARIAERVTARFVLFLGTHQSAFLALGGETQEGQAEDESKAQEGDWFFKPKPGPLFFSGPLRYLDAECEENRRFFLNWHSTRPIPDPLYPPRRWPDEVAGLSRSRQHFAEAYERLPIQHRPWIQGCLRDEQNAAPGDPSVDALLTVDASGAVRDMVLDSPPAYQGSRECLRARLRAFDFPALADQGETQVRFTFARPGHVEGNGRITDIACQSRADAKMQRQAAKLFGISYWADPAHLAWMVWAQNRQRVPELATTLLVARLLHSVGNDIEARRALSEVASWCPAVAGHLARTWGVADDARDLSQLSPDDKGMDSVFSRCGRDPSPAEFLEHQRRKCAAVAACLQIR